MPERVVSGAILLAILIGPIALAIAGILVRARSVEKGSGDPVASATPA